MWAVTRAAVVAFAFGACMAVAAPVRSDPGALVLAWSAPQACPQEAEFRTQVERLLRQSLAARREQSIAIAAAIRESTSGMLKLTIQIGTAQGNHRRELEHHDCRELSEAGALVTALAIDPSLVVESESTAAFEAKPEELAPATPAPPLPPVLPPAVPAPTSSPLPHAPPSDHSPAARSSVPLRPSMVVLGLAGNGALPGVGTGVGGQLAGGAQYFRVAARGVFWLERFQPISGFSGPGIALDAWALGLRGCGLPVEARLSLWACLGVDAGLLRGTGQDLEHSSSKSERWSAVTAELTGVYTTTSGLMTQLGFELGRALELPRFGISVDGTEREVFRANEWVAQVSVGIGFSFARPK